MFNQEIWDILDFFLFFFLPSKQKLFCLVCASFPTMCVFFSIFKTWWCVKRSLDILFEVKEQPIHLFLRLVPPLHLFLIRRNIVPSSLQSVKTIIGLDMHLKVMNRINRCEVLIFNLLQRRRSHLFHQRPSSLLSKYRSDYIYCQPF